MKLKRLILITIIISTKLLNAQTDFRSGYIIKSIGDTLYGNIDYRGDLLMSRVCKFKNDENAIVEFSPTDIIAYRFIDSKYYVSREINNRYVFLEYLIKGEINIYYLREKNGAHYFLDKEDVNLIEIPYDEGQKLVENTRVFYKTTKHIGILNYYMQDAPDFQMRISEIKRPDHQNLLRLAEDYHNAVCEGDKCIIYEAKLPPLKMNIEFISGFVNFNNIEDLVDISYFQSGILAHFWLPRSNPKLFLKTGFIFSQQDFTGVQGNIYKFPIHLEYLYPKGSFRPRFSYGFNYYHPFYQTVSLDLGLNIKLTEIFYLSATSDIAFNSAMLLIPVNILSYSINMGILLKL